MKKNNLSQIFENSKSHINKIIYSYLFMLIKYIFLWKNGIINKEKRDEIKEKLEEFTDKINNNIIKDKSKFINIKTFSEAFTLKNLNNILNFIKTQNIIYSGDIIEGILIVVFSYSFETTKDNEFGKYLFINMAKLREVMNPDLINWFKKAKNIFQSKELQEIKDLLKNDFSINDSKNLVPNFPLIHKFLVEMTKYKFDSININNGNNKTLEYINKGKLELTQSFLNKFRTMKNYTNNLTMLDKDFINNSMAFLYYHLFVEPSFPPIKIIRCFFISIYIYYQNEHSPLMKYIEPYKPKDEKDEKLEVVPFTYSLKGAFIEGRFSNTIMSPIKVEPRISNINFGQNNIRELGLFELGKTLSMSKHIKSVVLKISLLRTYFLDYFISAIGVYTNNNVEELNLSMNYLKEDSGYSLINFLSHFQNLKTLNLSSNEMKGAAKYIFVYFKKQYRKGKSKLENLYMNNCILDDSSFYELGELLKSKYCKLKKLSIGSNNKSKVINFLKKIKNNRSLEELNLFKSGLKKGDIEDICKIISNTNILHLNFFKNQFNNFKSCINMVFRTKIVKEKNELKEEQKYIVDKSSSLMTLDLSNSDIDSLNEVYIDLINDLIKNNNSTIGCLDLSRIFYGPYPDKENKNLSETYRKSMEINLADTLKKRKDIFFNLSFENYSKDIGVNEYEAKKEEEKMELKNKENFNKMMDIIHNPIDINAQILPDEKGPYNNNDQYLILKEKSIKFLKYLKENKKGNEDDEFLKNIEGFDEKDPTYKYLIDKMINYMKYEKDKEELDEVNRKLIDKNLILV